MDIKAKKMKTESGVWIPKTYKSDLYPLTIRNISFWLKYFELIVLLTAFIILMNLICFIDIFVFILIIILCMCASHMYN